MLLNMADDFGALASVAVDDVNDQLQNLVAKTQEVEEAFRQQPNDRGGYWHNDFGEERLLEVQSALDLVGSAAGLSDDAEIVGEDVPRFFPAKELPGFVEALAEADATGRDISQFVDSLNLRIRGLFTPGPLTSVVDPGNAPSISLEQWLTDYIGANEASNGPIAVIDLSLVPSEAIHVVVAVLARMVFEAVQRHRKKLASELPTVLVLDEAHTFVHRDLTAQGAPAPGRTCCQTFERIAREGRKFGLGLVLASQRPSEVSPTVLSQCNTFLLHRLVNDRDQELVRRLVPDGLGDLLRELPSLPSRRGILLGWGAPAPVLVEINDVPESQRPYSPDPGYWRAWTGEQLCPIDWETVATEWSGKSVETE